jgi:hypothetical protein
MIKTLLNDGGGGGGGGLSNSTSQLTKWKDNLQRLRIILLWWNV